METSRRKFIKHMSAAPLAIGAASSVFPMFPTALANATPAARLGSITGNDPDDYLAFADWFGKKPQLALLAFNQTSAANLFNSIKYICQQGAAFMADGAQIMWSVPCPGAYQLEAIVAGSFNSLYTKLFQSIIAVSPRDTTSILVRLPWEFNLAGQENAAIDQTGKFHAPVFVQAWQQIAAIAKAVSSRFARIWCPNVLTMGIDPATCWVGLKNVEIISQDFYMQSAYNKAGDFSYFLNEARGLQWGADFAHYHGKQYGLSEWGMDSDKFVNDFNATATWLAHIQNSELKSPGWTKIGGLLHHHCWWDRCEVIDSRISDGTHPNLAAAYRAKFG